MVIKTRCDLFPGNRPIQWPRMADASSDQLSQKASSAMAVPPLLARSDFPTSPRTRCAQDVVMPQEGHRMFQCSINQQGLNPNC